MSKSIIINEQQVLACILNNPKLIEQQKDCYFINEISISIFKSLRTLYENKADFLTKTVVSLASRENPDVDESLIDGIKSCQYSEDSYDYYSKRLRGDFVKNKLVTETIKNATEKLISKDELDLATLDEMQADIISCRDLINQNSNLFTMEDCVKDYEKNLKSAGNDEHFTSSGNRWLDEKLYGNGFEYGQITCIYGRSGNGKSIFAEKLINGKINMYDPVLYIPTEMGRLSTMDRLMAMRTGLTIDELTKIDEETGAIPDYVIQKVEREKNRLLRNKRFFLLDQANLTILELKAIVHQLKLTMNVEHLTIFIDLASMLEDFNGDNKASRYEDSMNLLQQKVAKEESSAIVAVFQSKRKDNVSVSCYDDCKKFAPTIEELKNSGGIEERCRVVLSVFRQRFYGERTLGKEDPEVMVADDIMNVHIQKQNNGPLDEINYLYSGSCASLYHIDTLDEEDTANVSV